MAAPYERSEWTIWSGLGWATKWILLIGGAVIILLPFAWMLGTSFKPQSDVFGYPLRLQPTHPTLSNYVAIWRELPFARLVLNSIVFAGGVTVLSVFFDSLAAYALARLRFPGRTVAFYLVLATLMVPFQVTLVPLFELVFHLHWLNTYQGLIVPRATSAFGIFLLRQFFVSVPRELDEAARVDGASEWHIYRRIMLPLAKPALATLGVFYFMNNWNDFLWPLVITTGTSHENLPAGLTLFSGQYVIQHGVLMAGAVISLLPLAVAFMLAQRYFVRGIATTGIK
ncbi:MAG: carbohydrate ABC transporter permease [Gaiellaceae bacterium]